MTHPEDTTDATQRVEQTKCLIQEAQSARQSTEPLVRMSLDEIDRTRRVSEAMANLAQLIDSMNDGG